MSIDTKYEYHYPLTDAKTVFSQEIVDSHFIGKQDDYKPKEDETILIFVRHGQNESNVERKFGGRTIDTPLTLLGYEQSGKTGEKLKAKVSRIDHVITSTMCRTSQTARKILELFSSSVEPKFAADLRLEERNAGEYEGKSLDLYAEVNVHDKKTSASTTLTFKEKMEFSPGQGVESYASVWNRAQECLYATCIELKGKVVLSVADSGVFRSIYWHLSQQLGFFTPYDNFKPDNGSYMIISVKTASITLLETDGVKIIPPTS